MPIAFSGSAMAERAAIVTGAASGVGLATTELLLERGFDVVGLDLRGPPAELATVAGLRWTSGDITTEEVWVEALELAGRSAAKDGPVLCACAADLVIRPFLETTLEDWRRLLEINVLGVVRGMQMMLPAMIERGYGRIGVVCSVNSFFVEELLSGYSTTKAALLHVVRSAALEYAKNGVRINAVCPGAIDTPLLARAFAELDDPAGVRRAVERRTPTGKIVPSRDIAEALYFLVAEAPASMSGAALTVDGGLTTAYDFEI
ncbi:MAG: SDR family oxidoreductase [Actinobacteria bacterium]|nr:SDR family oxidoreductase [Actinomycetota bacterium]